MMLVCFWASPIVLIIILGYRKWCTIRQEWLKQTGPNQKKKPIPVDVDSVVDLLSDINGPAFETPVPLNEMVNILLEMWEADGLFD